MNDLDTMITRMSSVAINKFPSTEMINTTVIHYAPRGNTFKTFLEQVLSLSSLKERYKDVLLDDYGIRMYHCAFTHITVDPIHNYEYLEFLGDTTLNKSIAWYLPKRFPQLRCAEGVKILTRLKINLISKRSFATFAKALHFWEFVSCDVEVRSTKMDKTLEDVFEAFFGVTETLLDQRIRHGVGYAVCYDMISSLLDRYELSLKYEDLFDAKTRLKEIIDHFGAEFGTIKYESEKTERTHEVSVVYTNKEGTKTLGKGSSPLKADAQQKAADVAIKTLKMMGYVKALPECYKRFCETE